MKEDLRVRIGGNISGLNQSLSKATQQVDKFASDVTARFKRLGIVLTAAFVPMTIMGVNFEKNMRFVGAVTNATEKEFKDLIAIAKEMGRTTEYTSSQSAQALIYLGLAGFKTKEAIAALPGTINLATAGMMDLGSAARISSSILRQMQLDVSEITRINDVLAKVQSTANTTIQEAADSFIYAGTIAKRFGMSVEEIAASIGLLANMGIRGSLAGTTLAQTMRKLADASGETEDIMERYTISLTDSTGRTKNFTEVLLDMVDANMNAVDAAKLLGARASNIAALFGLGREAIVDYIKSIYDSTGTTKRLSDAIRTSLWGSFKTLWSAIEATGLSLFDRYRDKLKELIDQGTEYVRMIEQWIIKNDELIKQKFESIFDGIKTTLEGIVDFVKMTPGLAQGGLAAYLIGGPLGFAAVVTGTTLLSKLWKAIFPQTANETLKRDLDEIRKRMQKLRKTIEKNEGRITESTFGFIKRRHQAMKEELAQLETRERTIMRTLGMDEAWNKLLKEQQEILEKSKPLQVIADVTVKPTKSTTPEYKSSSQYINDLSKYAEALDESTQKFKEIENSYWSYSSDRWSEYYRERFALQNDLTNKINQLTLGETKAREIAFDKETELLKNKYKNDQVVYDMIVEYHKLASQKMQKESNKLYTSMRDGIVQWGSTFASTINDMLWGSKKSFQDILKEFMKMITEIIIQYIVVGTIKKAFGITYAKGGVFDQGNVTPFASGAIVTTPTLFPMKNGNAGLMGEAGPEAIMPLKRTSKGELGIKATGTAQPSSIVIYMDNPQFQDIETQREHMSAIARIAVEKYAPNAIVRSYQNDDRIRNVLRSKM